MKVLKLIFVELPFLLEGFLIAFHKFQHNVVGCLNSFQVKVKYPGHNALIYVIKH